MSDERRKTIVEIASQSAGGADRSRNFIVQTSDLESIGSQLRGRTRFSFFNTVLPVIIALITLIGSTLIGQFFQYISWRNTSALQAVTDQANRAHDTFQTASIAITKRYYATYLFLDAAAKLATRKDINSEVYKLDLALNEQRYNAFYSQLRSWNDNYDQMLSAIDYDLDGPILQKHERVSRANFEKKDANGNVVKAIDCTKNATLLDQLQKLDLNISSLKVQFAVLNYCFANSIQDFSNSVHDFADSTHVNEKDNNVGDDTKIIKEKQSKASGLNESVREMSGEFRCYAQHYIDILELRKQTSIKWSASDPAVQFQKIRNDCSPAGHPQLTQALPALFNALRRKS